MAGTEKLLFIGLFAGLVIFTLIGMKPELTKLKEFWDQKSHCVSMQGRGFKNLNPTPGRTVDEFCDTAVAKAIYDPSQK